MSEFEQVVADGAFEFAGPDKLRTGKLGKVDGKKAEAEHIHGIDAF